MSDIIRLLPDSVANQIAAGEVIQRPSSVVKELVENAIDAEAREIHVLATDAGRTCIQVIDDGKGMSPTDARLAFERHSTSKIKEAADLFSLRTMGFRGEALASIAAVAQVELKTRQEEEELGTRIILSGSQVEAQETVACSKGSNFAVKNLFFNVPARRKFLKSNQTELNNILAEFERIVLVHPDVSFTFHHNDVELFNLPVSSLRQRILNVFGKRLAAQLLPLEVETGLVSVHGFVAKPEFAKKKGAYQYFFVNGRYMRHPYFHKAVMGVYEHLVPVGEQVSYFIYFEVDPADIDVNIHPTKTEIKFENEQAIWQILSAAVKEALGRFNAVPAIDFDTEGMPDIPVYNPASPVVLPKTGTDPVYNPFDPAENADSAVRYARPAVEWERLYEGIASHREKESGLFQQEDEEVSSGQAENGASALPGGAMAGTSLQYYQFKGRYVVTSVKSGLMLIDQHWAHVRILFDRYLAMQEEGRGASQGMLFPVAVLFSVAESVALGGIREELSAIGFDLGDLGGGTYSVNGVPAGIEGLDVAGLLRGMVHTAMETGSDVRDEVRRALALSMAKAVAIPYGQALSGEEMASLVDALFACPVPNYSPEGRAVVAVIREEEIERLFK